MKFLGYFLQGWQTGLFLTNREGAKYAKEEGRGKREEGRGKKEEGRRKKEEVSGYWQQFTNN